MDLIQPNHIVADAVIRICGEWGVYVPAPLGERPVLLFDVSERAVPVPAASGRLSQSWPETIHSHQLICRVSCQVIACRIVLTAVIGPGPQRSPVPSQDYRPPIAGKVFPLAGVSQFLHNGRLSAEGALHMGLCRFTPPIPRFPLVGFPHDRQEVPPRRGHPHVLDSHRRVLMATGSPNLLGAGTAKNVGGEQGVDGLQLSITQGRC